MSQQLRAISVRQPYPWAMLHAGKDIENRTQPLLARYRGEVLIHASKSMTWLQWLEEVHMISRASGRPLFPTYDEFMGRGRDNIWGDSIRLGGIVARADVVDCILPGGMTTPMVALGDGQHAHPAAQNRWYTGRWGAVLIRIRPVAFVPWPGALGLWKVPDRLAAALDAAQGASPCTP